jgi:hypothetical protein
MRFHGAVLIYSSGRRWMDNKKCLWIGPRDVDLVCLFHLRLCFYCAYSPPCPIATQTIEELKKFQNLFPVLLL